MPGGQPAAAFILIGCEHVEACVCRDAGRVGSSGMVVWIGVIEEAQYGLVGTKLGMGAR